MWGVDEGALGADTGHHLVDGEHIGDPLVEEQADQLTGRSPDLLAHDYSDAEVAAKSLLGRVDGVVIGDADDVETHELDSFFQLFEGGNGVTGPNCVQVTVEPNVSGGRGRWGPHGDGTAHRR